MTPSFLRNRVSGHAGAVHTAAGTRPDPAGSGANLLGNELSRTTIANVEIGRQAPSRHLWRLLEERLPGELSGLRVAYRAASDSGSRRLGRRRDTEVSLLLGGYVRVERYDIIYNFGESRGPEEIIELRQVVATRSGVRDYGLTHSHTGTSGYLQDTEVLCGGRLVTSERQAVDGKTVLLRRVAFDRVLDPR